ncbi:MAG TPA: glycoside hydrolase family 38 C-terminal domain-containing protein [Phycisphaerae bacterium]|nr:glycoside hydrolase family 38 C-terminal domain-containing protein [Phycisphaerae bacterium]HNU45083.1 glycoside hydrolase family 38 C-terminal domain-containing protein [Phycisphaerae bacterium]
MTRRTVHLLCNSHVDPAWLWQWQEGAGEALALTRTVVDLCARYPGFVFNRNEVMFHEWIAEYDPALFRRIRRLVRVGAWHLMGGWYVQPDCNMPCGESFVRQILVGKRYFRRTFGVNVTTAANLDSFGHSRGLVQILAKSGYDSYLFCRPSRADVGLPATQFVWRGYDGSEILATLADSHYNSAPGGARRKVAQWLQTHPTETCGIVPWGVGNHGGGPSRRDIRELNALIRATRDVDIRHSTPEAYFAQLQRGRGRLPRHEGDLNPWAVGCYTSMARVKQKHRKLENELYATEKMTATAAMQGLLPYPRGDFEEATRDLLAGEFHDALPGSSVPPVEDAVVQRLDHGLEILARLKMRAFLTLAAGQRRARTGEFPILVYNPHPYPVSTTVECELQAAWPHQTGRFMLPQVRQGTRLLPTQAEKEHANINEDHRKRVVFPGVLAPSTMNRFDCRLVPLPRRPALQLKERRGAFRLRTTCLDVVISARTGLLDRYCVHGRDYLAQGAFQPLVVRDNADPWGMTGRRFRTVLGRFRRMSRPRGAGFSGTPDVRLPCVRVIEDGPARSVVEALLEFGDSRICQRYKLPKAGTEMEVETRVHWNEKDRMLKLSLPTLLADPLYRAQVVYGVQELRDNGDEQVMQKWLAVTSRRADGALTIINDRIHGLDVTPGEVRLSLLRAAAHAGHPTGPGRPITAQDRYTARMDQGEHVFRFWLNAGPAGERLTHIDREALARNEEPFALCMSPSGEGRKLAAGVVVSDEAVQVTAIKQAADGQDWIIRLFEPTGHARTVRVLLPFAKVRRTVSLSPFEIKTLRVNRRTAALTEVNLLEKPEARHSHA